MDAGTLAILAGLLLAIAAGGYAWGRWRAVGWLGVAPWAAFALATDAAWWSGLWDRSDEYEPLPTSMFVFPLWIPLCCLVVTVAVLARRARRGSRRGLADKV
jgi:dolichyl-phosphate-mannose--protein O-mannosyl transferase